MSAIASSFLLNKKIIGVGTNKAPKKKNLEAALGHLRGICDLGKISKVYETSAMVPKGAPHHWHEPFLNMAVEVLTSEDPEKFLEKLKGIEKKMGRQERERWAPREIDLDILCWDQSVSHAAQLQIPHHGLFERSFVLDPVSDIEPAFLPLARSHPGRHPKWMVVFNLTPDSFSDGGSIGDVETFLKKYRHSCEWGAHYVDLGAEATGPRAAPIAPDEEWQRLEPFLKALSHIRNEFELKPTLSVDTRYASTAANALSLGVEVINDVSGLSDPAMIQVLRDSDCQYVLMHSLTVPADPQTNIVDKPVEEVNHWLDDKLETLESNGISRERIIFDPGIGFGKTAQQSQELLQNIESFHRKSLRLLVGHSRKSFMNGICTGVGADRDIETLGASLRLVESGVDILRIHNLELHVRAMRGWGHVTG